MWMSQSTRKFMDIWWPLVCCWNSPPLTNHCMTTSRSAAAHRRQLENLTYHSKISLPGSLPATICLIYPGWRPGHSVLDHTLPPQPAWFTQAGHLATVCWTIHSRHNPPDLPRLDTWPQCAGPYTPTTTLLIYPGWRPGHSVLDHTLPPQPSWFTQAGDMATVCWTIHSHHNPPDLPRLETWPQCAGPYTPATTRLIYPGWRHGHSVLDHTLPPQPAWFTQAGDLATVCWTIHSRTCFQSEKN